MQKLIVETDLVHTWHIASFPYANTAGPTMSVTASDIGPGPGRGRMVVPENTFRTMCMPLIPEKCKEDYHLLSKIHF